MAQLRIYFGAGAIKAKVSGTAATEQAAQSAAADGQVNTAAPVQRGTGGMPIPFIQRKRLEIAGIADAEQDAQRVAASGKIAIGGAGRSRQAQGIAVAVGRRSMARQNEKTLLALIMRDAA